MGNEMREHVTKLGRHGVKVYTAAVPELLSGAFYDRIVEFCKQYGINCLAYDIDVPGIAEPMLLAIWKNGHVDSGSADHIHAVMDQ